MTLCDVKLTYIGVDNAAVAAVTQIDLTASEANGLISQACGELQNLYNYTYTPNLTTPNVWAYSHKGDAPTAIRIFDRDIQEIRIERIEHVAQTVARTRVHPQ